MADDEINGFGRQRRTNTHSARRRSSSYSPRRHRGQQHQHPAPCFSAVAGERSEFGQRLRLILQQRQLHDAMQVLNDETHGGGLAADTVLTLDVFRDRLNAAVVALQDAGTDEQQIFRRLRRLAMQALKEVREFCKEMLESLEKENDADDGVKECSICLVEFVDDGEVSVVPCPSRHNFHRDCITRWLEISNTCPLCRHELPTDDDAYDQ